MLQRHGQTRHILKIKSVINCSRWFVPPLQTKASCIHHHTVKNQQVLQIKGILPQVRQILKQNLSSAVFVSIAAGNCFISGHWAYLKVVHQHLWQNHLILSTILPFTACSRPGCLPTHYTKCLSSLLQK